MKSNKRSHKSLSNIATLVDKIGLTIFSENDLLQISKKYKQELQSGLQKEKSSLQMLPTHLKRVHHTKLIPGEEAIVIEIGGTHIYGARVIINKYAKPVLVKQGKNDIFFKKKINRNIFANPLDFFEHVLAQLDGLFGKIPHAIAIIYSFPGTSLKKAYGIDLVSSEKLPKDFIIPGISKLPIGKTLLTFINEKYPIGSVPLVVLNDTPAVMLADKMAAIGGVLGTGFNLAITVKEYIYNTESGSFFHIPLSPIVMHIDEKSNNPGGGIAEKQISGLYLGQTFQRVIELYVEQGILPKHFQATYSSGHVSHILRFKRLPNQQDNYEMYNELFYEIAQRITKRSAQLVGTMIGTIIVTFPKEFPKKRVIIPIEGSVFWGVPFYRDQVSMYAQEICHKRITFVRISKAGVKGAAVAALTVKREIASWK